MATRRSRIVGFLVALTLAPLPAWPLHADGSDAAQLEEARTNFKEGLALEKAGDYASAVLKFEATKRVKATPQVRFHIALCEERLGHWISAAEGYEAAAKQASFEGSAPEVLKVAPDLAKKLRAKIPRLTIVVTGGPAKALAVDGRAVVLEEAKQMPVDPGKHVVTANDPEWNTRKIEIALGAGEDRTVTISFPTPAASEPPPPPPPATPVETPVATSNAQAHESAALVAAGVGVAGLGLGFVFLALRGKAVSDLDDQCPARKCPPSAQSDIDRAHTYTTVSRIGFGVSVVGAAAAIVILATGGKSEPPKTGRITPWAPTASLGLGVQGAF